MKRITPLELAAVGLVAAAAVATLWPRSSQLRDAPSGAESPTRSEQAQEPAPLRGIAGEEAVRTPNREVSPGERLCALAEAAQAAEGDEAEAAWRRLIGSMQSNALPAWLGLLADDTHPSTAKQQLEARLLDRWAREDPLAAWCWAQGLAQPGARREAMRQVAVIQSETDLEGAIAWARRLPEGEPKVAVVLGLGYEAARVDAPGALNLAVSLAASPERDDLLVHCLSQWAAADPAAAAGWAASLPEPQLRRRAVEAVSTAWAVRDTQAAVDFALENLMPGPDQDRAVVGIVQRWSELEPEGAAAWVEQFPEVPSREPAVESLVTLWAAREPAAVAQWLAALPLGKLHDEGIAAYKRCAAVAAQSQPGDVEAVGQSGR